MQTADWFDTQGLADWLGIPPATVKAWRRRGTGPPAYRIGRHVRYRRADVERWLAARADRRPAPR